MAYLRFLTNKDYISIATEAHMKQLIRGTEERIPQAEQRAEMKMLEYLDQYYEIEKVLAVGKNIREYNVGVTYPGGVYLRKDEDIFKTLRRINGIKKPTKTVYWKQVMDFIEPHLIDRAKKYSQLRMYAKGEVVRFGTEYWQCVTPHGYEANEVHTPGAQAWKEAEVTEWLPNMDWEKNQVCSFNGNFYQYLGEEEVEDDLKTEDEIQEAESQGNNVHELVLTPEEDDRWGKVGEYTEDFEYSFGEGVFDYVVAEGGVFYPIMNPNPDHLEEGVNITRDDPRNTNIVSHMSQIALYNLHAIISATNIPETRRWAYEDSIQWLYNASKFKINPQLPRKRECESSLPKVDWACETFQRDYNPNENPWLI